MAVTNVSAQEHNMGICREKFTEEGDSATYECVWSDQAPSIENESAQPEDFNIPRERLGNGFDPVTADWSGVQADENRTSILRDMMAIWVLEGGTPNHLWGWHGEKK